MLAPSHIKPDSPRMRRLRQVSKVVVELVLIPAAILAVMI